MLVRGGEMITGVHFSGCYADIKVDIKTNVHKQKKYSHVENVFRYPLVRVCRAFIPSLTQSYFLFLFLFDKPH